MAHLPRLKRCVEYFGFSSADDAVNSSLHHIFDQNLTDNSMGFFCSVSKLAFNLNQIVKAFLR